MSQIRLVNLRKEFKADRLVTDIAWQMMTGPNAVSLPLDWIRPIVIFGLEDQKLKKAGEG